MKPRDPWIVVACAAALLVLSGGSATVVGEVGDEVEMVRSGGEARTYWPRWRGPSGQGHVEGSGYPDRWSRDDGVLWRVPVPGAGNSSPVIWGDRVYVTTARDARSRSLLAFDRDDGELLWETEVPEASPESPHPKNGFASATPTVDGERVYAFFGNHGLVAFDLEGGIVWRTDLGEFANYHGTAGSPLLYEDRVILYQDQEEDGFVAAFDAATGERLWRTEREQTVGWGTPVAIRTPERDAIVVSGQRRVTAYDPGTGAELWTVEGNTFEVIPTPVVGHDLIFCASGRAGPTLAIRPGGSGDVTDTHVAWESPKGSPFVPSPILVGEYLFMVNDMQSILTVHDARTGETVGQRRLGEPRREGFSASPVAVAGKVFFTDDEGRTFAISAEPDFEVLHVNELGERTLASPALVDGRWYFRTAGHLVAIGE